MQYSNVRNPVCLLFRCHAEMLVLWLNAKLEHPYTQSTESESLSFD